MFQSGYFHVAGVTFWNTRYPHPQFTVKANQREESPTRFVSLVNNIAPIVENTHVRAILVDAPEAASFSAGPERIYISRKMVALLRNDHELAGLLAHELGHMRRRQLDSRHRHLKDEETLRRLPRLCREIVPVVPEDFRIWQAAVLSDRDLACR
jgi:hypothetical protein